MSILPILPDRKARLKISKHIEDNVLNQPDLSDIYRAPHPRGECIFFPSAHGIVSMCQLDHKFQYIFNHGVEDNIKMATVPNPLIDSREPLPKGQSACSPVVRQI